MDLHPDVGAFYHDRDAEAHARRAADARTEEICVDTRSRRWMRSTSYLSAGPAAANLSCLGAPAPTQVPDDKSATHDERLPGRRPVPGTPSEPVRRGEAGSRTYAGGDRISARPLSRFIRT
jgi:hypothetical protein